MNWFLVWLFAPPLIILAISAISLLRKGEITFDPPDGRLRLRDYTTDALQRTKNRTHQRDKGWRRYEP